MLSQAIHYAGQAKQHRSHLINPKDDNSHIFYVRPSYGVGSSVGDVNGNFFIADDDSKLLEYNSIESGYVIAFNCI